MHDLDVARAAGALPRRGQAALRSGARGEVRLKVSEHERADWRRVVGMMRG